MRSPFALPFAMITPLEWISLIFFILLFCYLAHHAIKANPNAALNWENTIQ